MKQFPELHRSPQKQRFFFICTPVLLGCLGGIWSIEVLVSKVKTQPLPKDWQASVLAANTARASSRGTEMLENSSIISAQDVINGSFNPGGRRRPPLQPGSLGWSAEGETGPVHLSPGVPPLCPVVSKHPLMGHVLVQEGRDWLKPRRHAERALGWRSEPKKAQGMGRGLPEGLRQPRALH